MHSDDETVDVAGSEEEETDSEREPSAEATISTVAFFFYHQYVIFPGA